MQNTTQRLPISPTLCCGEETSKLLSVNNEPVDDEVLAGHRTGYSGLASLKYAGHEKNLFVPLYAGLNFEHILDGTKKFRGNFEPRRVPMEIRRINKYTAELYQAPTPYTKFQSRLRYELLDDGAIEMTVECIPHERIFKNDFIILFFASYINQPESVSIHFLGRRFDEKGARPKWVKDDKYGAYIATDDKFDFAHDPDYTWLSDYRYSEPWYYGVVGDMALVQMFRKRDDVRFFLSPSGGGEGNPAWDFYLIIPQYKVGRQHRFVMRMMLLPFESPQQITSVTARHRTALNPE